MKKKRRPGSVRPPRERALTLGDDRHRIKAPIAGTVLTAPAVPATSVASRSTIVAPQPFGPYQNPARRMHASPDTRGRHGSAGARTDGTSTRRRAPSRASPADGRHQPPATDRHGRSRPHRCRPANATHEIRITEAVRQERTDPGELPVSPGDGVRARLRPAATDRKVSWRRTVSGPRRRAPLPAAGVQAAGERAPPPTRARAADRGRRRDWAYAAARKRPAAAAAPGD